MSTMKRRQDRSNHTSHLDVRTAISSSGLPTKRTMDNHENLGTKSSLPSGATNPLPGLNRITLASCA
ncbi:hypothetical protein CYLTODRAFT_173130 [Cylindrobasidium torrendii FP15055 ss-10]|uniref:Uncharacterized protein n=1 Tax=Cylindrobasidium torrendii FP15055 ss-10 TaxID=1314674 RepID=A0A0D7AXG4_9AGAR|nr:hypothetical protein CYLTODRAFT_173130 [Cylindrobasidium torrendii FP15055 ss-10]